MVLAENKDKMEDKIDIIIRLDDNIHLVIWCYHLVDDNIDFIIWQDDNILLFIRRYHLA
jgi:hypothetical protein